MSSVSLIEPNGQPFLPSLRRISVPEYHRMNEAGILLSGEPFELINGLLVFKDRSSVGEARMTVGRSHIWAVKVLGRLDRNLDNLDCHMQLQSPVVMSEYDEPEPDGAILAGTIDDYKLRKAEAKDVHCVIEVSDSSLRRDRTEKLSLYANSGIRQYVIINLSERVVEVYANPISGEGRYEHLQTLAHDGTVQFFLGEGRTLDVPASELLL